MMQKAQIVHKATVSAPGKLMLLGEHAVVYGYPCIVIAVDRRMRIEIKRFKGKELRIRAPEVGVTEYVKQLGQIGQAGFLKKEIAFIETAVSVWKEKFGLETGISIETTSDFSSEYGFGSSSAVTVAVIKALATLFGKNLSQKELFDLCYNSIVRVQKKGSGFDVAAAIYGGTIFFQNQDGGGWTIEDIRMDNKLPLVVAYSGVKADTVTLIEKVAAMREKESAVVNGIFEEIGMLVKHGKKALNDGDWKTLGELMNKNQTYVDSLGVSSGKLDQMISAAKTAGAYGAKFSGAGGGDCMIALVSEEKQEAVEHAIKKAGGQVLKVTPDAQGVRVEKEML